MHIGFTGTRAGMTGPQMERLRTLLEDDRPTHVHHGDCVGADTEFHAIAVGCNARVWIETHPCDIGRYRKDSNANVVHPQKPPLDRNRDIVNACDVLMAAPNTMQEEMRSGTWATVRYARKAGKSVIIVWPNGLITRERI